MSSAKCTWNIVPVKANTIPLLALKLTSFTLWNIGWCCNRIFCLTRQIYGVWPRHHLPPPALLLLRLLGGLAGAGPEVSLCFGLSWPELTITFTILARRGRGEVRWGERSDLLKGQSSLPRTDSAASTLIFSLELLIKRLNWFEQIEFRSSI